MNNEILIQLAHSRLLPNNLAQAIFAGNEPPIEDLVLHIVIGAMDAHAVTINDPQNSWTEKRLAWMALAVAFLSAMAVLRSTEA